MNNPPPSLQRTAIYVAAFLFPPIVIGITLAVVSMAKVMIHREPPALAAEAGLPAPPRAKVGQPTALVLLSPAGTQLTELLSSVEVLGEAGFRVLTASTRRQPLPTTGAVAVLPHVDLGSAPQAELLVVPSLLDPSDQALQNFAIQRAKSARLIVGLGEGVVFLAQSGLLEDRRVTSHFIAIERLREEFPKISVLPDESYVLDGGILTSQGLASSPQALREAARQLQSPESEPVKASSLLPPGLGPTDYLQLIFRAGFDWNKQSLAAILLPGVAELSLAAPLEILPRTFSVTTETLAPDRTPVRTRHGLDLIASEIASEAVPFDFLFYPEGTAPKQLELPAPMGRVVTFDSSGEPFALWLKKTASWEGPAITQLVATLIRAPEEKLPPNASPGAPIDAIEWIPIPQILALGILGLLLAWLVDARVRRRETPSA